MCGRRRIDWNLSGRLFVGFIFQPLSARLYPQRIFGGFSRIATAVIVLAVVSFRDSEIHGVIITGRRGFESHAAVFAELCGFEQDFRFAVWASLQEKVPVIAGYRFS
jgi:hypothetical protein